ncbi:MAG: response regulator [Verrucomicrobiota bacterium]
MNTRILTIDDSHTLRAFIADSLTKYSKKFEVITAQNAEEGLAFARSQHPDLILLDFILPDMNGERVCEQLLSEAHTDHIPVIFLSSDNKNIREAARKFQNVKRTLTKPFTPELLCATVNFVLRNTTLTFRRNGISGTQPIPAPQTMPEKQPAGAFKPRPATRPLKIGLEDSQLEQKVQDTTKPTPAPTPATRKIPLPKTKPLLQVATTTSPSLVFCGNTHHFPLMLVLRAIDEQKLSGVLKTFIQETPQELYVKDGMVAFNTTKNMTDYLQGANLNFPPDQQEALNNATNEQGQSSKPFFLTLHEADLLSEEKAVHLTRQFGSFLFSRNWIFDGLRFEFQDLYQFPDFIRDYIGEPITISDWTVESLRHIQAEEIENIEEFKKSSGTPAYTRRGFEHMVSYGFDEEEFAFAEIVNKGGRNLNAIAEELGYPIEHTRSLLFRFLTMGIMDYWPENSLLQL